MRFNDLMQTVLAAGDGGGPNPVTLWRQCVDLLAQRDRAGRSDFSDEERAALIERLAGLRNQLNETQRLATVVELGGRLRSPILTKFFCDDRPSVTAAAIARAQLPDAAWVAMLPELGPTARGVLRSRRDIGHATRKALEAFGAHDLVLTTARHDMVGVPDLLLTADMEPQDARPRMEAATVTPLRRPVGDESQIRNLVDRIARFTSERKVTEVERSASLDVPNTIPGTFAFETDAVGIIRWVDKGPRAALVGLSLADPSYGHSSGPDGYVAGAFRRRSGFQSGRFTIIGGAMAGEWRLSATPYFDRQSGRFEGFRGEARRPYLHEVAHGDPAADIAVAGLSPDSLRQLVHELRTPLNAILGFAEIIEQEMFGPAGAQYKDMAGKIVADAQHLLVAFDDLELAAKITERDGNRGSGTVDPALLLTQIMARFRDMADRRIEIDIAPQLPPMLVEAVQGERMIQHLFRTLVSVSLPDEAVRGNCRYQADGPTGRIVLALDRPASLAGREEGDLLDPSYDQDGQWPDGPLLGLGFSLRLIRSLASACGGGLDIAADRFLLSVPATTAVTEVADQA